jgi:hypothetical protein
LIKLHTEIAPQKNASQSSISALSFIYSIKKIARFLE